MSEESGQVIQAAGKAGLFDALKSFFRDFLRIGGKDAEQNAAKAGEDAARVAGKYWTGARYIESLSPAAEAAYAAIRESAADVPKIAENIGIRQDVIAQVKEHLFMSEHDVPIGPGQVLHGYFTADESIATLWGKAEAGSLTAAEQDQFRNLMAHEYVESRLMESGMPYRSARWAQELDATSDWPFFDIAARIAPEVTAPPHLASRLETLISARIGWPSVAVSCRAALRWAALLDVGMPTLHGLEDPFEPLILFFERGGGFTTEHGFIDLGGAAIRQQTWQDRLATEPVVTLDQSTLDALDSAGIQ